MSLTRTAANAGVAVESRKVGMDSRSRNTKTVISSKSSSRRRQLTDASFCSSSRSRLGLIVVLAIAGTGTHPLEVAATAGGVNVTAVDGEKTALSTTTDVATGIGTGVSANDLTTSDVTVSEFHHGSILDCLGPEESSYNHTLSCFNTAAKLVTRNEGIDNLVGGGSW